MFCFPVHFGLLFALLLRTTAATAITMMTIAAAAAIKYVSVDCDATLGTAFGEDDADGAGDGEDGNDVDNDAVEDVAGWAFSILASPKQ